MRELLRQSKLYFALLTAAAFALRLFFIFKYAVIAGDALFYGELGKTLLEQGVLGATAGDTITPCIIRMPGYPGFMAAVWAVVGVEHYRAVLFTQMFFDVGTCFLVADLALRTLRSQRAARAAFLLAALCPFTAEYAAAALTETLAIFFAVLALDLAAAACDSGRLRTWASCGAALAAGILLRPDGGILMAVIAGYVVLRRSLRRRVVAAFVLCAVALAPLVPWTMRNWRDFHVFQPLVPRYANAPDEFVPLGFARWAMTWMVDCASVPEVCWSLGEEEIDVSKAPARAFDSAEERARVERLFVQYNATKAWTPELDRQLGGIAAERIARHPLRYYIAIPALRIAQMWLRPRTQTIPVDDRWWNLDDPHDFVISLGMGFVNLIYVLLAAMAVGRWLWPGHALEKAPRYWGMLLAFVIARSLFLGSVGNPEPRYTLECFPAVMVFASAALAGVGARENVHDRVAQAVSS